MQSEDFHESYFAPVFHALHFHNGAHAHWPLNGGVVPERRTGWALFPVAESIDCHVRAYIDKTVNRPVKEIREKWKDKKTQLSMTELAVESSNIRILGKLTLTGIQDRASKI